MEMDSRLYNCAHCHKQCVICSCCDRGNIYCQKCSQEARKGSLKASGRRYQNTPQGKRNHAARQRRYRQRQREKLKIVTHHSSSSPITDDLLPTVLDETKLKTILKKEDQNPCHFCGRLSSAFLRMGFIQSKIRVQRKMLCALGP